MSTANNPFRKKSYLGKVVYLDVETKDIVAAGHGQFEVDDMSMSVSLTAIATGQYRQLMAILTTTEGHVAPFAMYRQTLLIDTPIVTIHQMDAYLRWPVNADISSITQMFSSIDIIIEARHSRDETSSVIDQRGIVARMTRFAVAKQLGVASYKNLRITTSAGYTLRQNGGRVHAPQDESKMDTYVKYHFQRTTSGGFRIRDIGRLLLAFKLNWIINHDSLSCTISSIKLGDYITLVLADNKLATPNTSLGSRQVAPTIQMPLRIDSLVKMAHFFFNPQNKKTLSASSKAGLAFMRIIDYRFKARNKVIDMDIASLIFALQSLTESCSEGELRKRHRASAAETKAGIRAMLDAIHSLRDAVPEEVAAFYVRSENEIYKISLRKLDIDIEKYRPMLRAIDKARRQVVHSEGYNAEFLLNLLAHSTTHTKVDDDGLVRSVIVAHGVSEVDRLYALLKLMVKRYFELYEQ